MNRNLVFEHNDTELLNRFNKREISAFGEIYSFYYDDLYYYSLKLYKDTGVEPEDVIHDVLIHLWQAKNTFFDKIADIKAYLFVSIRNNFNHKIRNDITAEKYTKYIEQFDDMLETDIIESEIMATLNHELNLLPEDSALIIRLFLEGHSIDAIVEKINLSKRTVYNKKNLAISHLRKKMIKNKILVVLLSVSNL